MIARVIRTGGAIAEWICVLLLFAMFAITLAGVAARYLFNAPISWSDELGMILLLWCVFLADAFVTRDKDHIAFDMVWDRASANVRRWLLIFQTVFFGVIFALALPIVVDYILFLKREQTSSLLWRLDAVFFCFAIYLAMVVVRLAAKLARVIGPDWRNEVADSDAGSTANIIG